MFRAFRFQDVADKDVTGKLRKPRAFRSSM